MLVYVCFIVEENNSNFRNQQVRFGENKQVLYRILATTALTSHPIYIHLSMICTCMFQVLFNKQIMIKTQNNTVCFRWHDRITMTLGSIFNSTRMAWVRILNSITIVIVNMNGYIQYDTSNRTCASRFQNSTLELGISLIIFLKHVSLIQETKVLTAHTTNFPKLSRIWCVAPSKPKGCGITAVIGSFFKICLRKVIFTELFFLKEQVPSLTVFTRHCYILCTAVRIPRWNASIRRCIY